MRPLSARNPRIQRLARLARRGEERAAQRALLVEGPVLLGTALDAQVPLVDVYVDEAAWDRGAVAAVLERLPASVEPWLVPPGVLDRVGDAATSQGITAVVERREPPWPTPAATPFVLVLAEVSDPGNAGTLIRAAAAAGAGAVVVGGGVDPSSPKVVRSSAGAIFGIDVVDTLSSFDSVAKLRALGYRTAGMVVRDGTPHDAADLTGPLAVVLGNEAHGLSPELVATLDQQLTIEMAGPTESLNVAMAGTVVCFEVLRQRRRT
ncbi:RNA methyltransferase [Aquihabitans sp. G128]|uniref:TrmH family RNA methyltransferase n=1 Tax=Aquihabitans sp. G128 TaxID=2849779 RepID=UPI001C224FA6|nr:RNA methyltransferase [Aquihabitans sp. G128]QXC61901.1 RNA methyltransferase [Aquihabitans sp. G128]